MFSVKAYCVIALLLSCLVQASEKPKILIYVLCYDSLSCHRGYKYFGLFPWSVMLRLPQSEFFESHAFTHIFPKRRVSDNWDDYDYIGTLSWKAPIKFMEAFRFGQLDIDDILMSAPRDTDVIGMVGQREQRNMLQQTNLSHPRFGEVWEGLLLAYGVYSRGEISTEGMVPFYCNYWLARPQHVVKFIAFMQKARYFLESLKSIQDALWSDAQYWVNKNVSQAVFGLDYYAYHPFVLERLTPFFFNSEKLKIHIYKRYPRVWNVYREDERSLWKKAIRFARMKIYQQDHDNVESSAHPLIGHNNSNKGRRRSIRVSKRHPHLHEKTRDAKR